MGYSLKHRNYLSRQPPFLEFNKLSLRTGARIGQGTGFCDLEWGILSEMGVVDEKTIVATTGVLLEFSNKKPEKQFC